MKPVLVPSRWRSRSVSCSVVDCSGLSSLRLRWTALAIVGFGLQFLLPPGNWPFVL